LGIAVVGFGLHSPPSPRAVGGCLGWRLSPVSATVRRGGDMRRPAVMFALTLAVGGVRFTSWKDETPGGRSTPRCGGREAGSRPGGEKHRHGRRCFFYLTAPGHGELNLTHNFMSNTNFESFSSGNWQKREFLHLPMLQNLHDIKSITQDCVKSLQNGPFTINIEAILH
jgi:hypothetical protein